VTYELTCKDFKKYEGDKVLISGTLQAAATQIPGAISMICVGSISLNGAGGGALPIIVVSLLGGGAVAYVLYEVNQSTPPASR
jgi:hypothetical protein